MKKNKLVQEWLERASDDEQNAISILKHKDGTSALVCFLSQQMTEKYLKALIMHLTKDYPKTHDLRKLQSLIQPYIKPFPVEIFEAIGILNPHYIGTRYPADIPIESFTWRMAKEAFEAALCIKKFVLENIKQ